jgi:hypothetical protein
MKLSKEDSALFYQLMDALLDYTNQRFELFPSMSFLDGDDTRDLDEVREVRDCLYDNIELIDDFIAENPHRFSRRNLDIIRDWKRFKRARFFIERQLKRYAVFIDPEDKVYGVLGLYSTVAEACHPRSLPVLADAVLLPFKGRITYDRYLGVYPWWYGGRIRASLRETYMRAKLNNRIIVSFDPQRRPRPKKPATPPRDWTPELREMAAKARKMRATAGHSPLHSPTFSLLRAALDVALEVTDGPYDLEEVTAKVNKLIGAVRKLARVVERLEG